MALQTQIAIVGGGVSSGVLACLTRQYGFETILVEARDPKAPLISDSRAFAVVRGGWRVLSAAGLTQALESHAQPLVGMEAHDKRGALPDAASRFGMDDLPLSQNDEPLGHLVEVDRLMASIDDGIGRAEGLHRCAPDTATALDLTGTKPKLTLDSGHEIEAEIVIGADGVGSSLRDFAGLRTQGWSYNQSVLAVTVQLDEPHRGIARQWFQDEGPFAVLPLTENRANLAWFRKSGAAAASATLSKAELENELNTRFSHLCGQMHILKDPLTYPLKLQFAEELIAPNMALVGDAIRRISPLAGQGFNLGLKDIAALIEILVETRRLGLPLGHGVMLERYQQWRRFDGLATALAMDVINRTYSGRSSLMSPLRHMALSAGGAFSPIRKLLARQASADQPGLPKLVRGEPLVP